MWIIDSKTFMYLVHLVIVDELATSVERTLLETVPGRFSKFCDLAVTPSQS